MIDNILPEYHVPSEVTVSDSVHGDTYAIGQIGETCFWFGPCLDIWDCLNKRGKDKYTRLYKINGFSCQLVYDWCDENHTWMRSN